MDAFLSTPGGGADFLADDLASLCSDLDVSSPRVVTPPQDDASRPTPARSTPARSSARRSPGSSLPFQINDVEGPARGARRSTRSSANAAARRGANRAAPAVSADLP